jgi:hypothetical protein
MQNDPKQWQNFIVSHADAVVAGGADSMPVGSVGVSKVSVGRENKMKVFTLLCALTLIVFLVACRDEPLRIPEGTYVSESGAETIEVSKIHIRFRIMPDQQESTGLVDRTYQYEVLPDGILQPYPMASAEMLTGIGKFECRWNGEQITQMDRRNRGSREKLYRRVMSQ